MIKRVLKSNHYTPDDEVKAVVNFLIIRKSEGFFSDSMKNLLHIRRNVLDLTAIILKNKCINPKLKNCSVMYDVSDVTI